MGAGAEARAGTTGEDEVEEKETVTWLPPRWVDRRYLAPPNDDDSDEEGGEEEPPRARMSQWATRAAELPRGRRTHVDVDYYRAQAHGYMMMTSRVRDGGGSNNNHDDDDDDAWLKAQWNDWVHRDIRPAGDNGEDRGPMSARSASEYLRELAAMADDEY